MRNGWLYVIASLSIAGCAGAETEDGTGAEDGVAEVSQDVSAGTSWHTLWLPHTGFSGISRIETARNADGSLALFGQLAGSGGGMLFAKQAAPNSGWTPPVWLDGGANRDFAVGRNADGRLEVFALGGVDGAIYHQWQTAPNATTWSGWHLLGGGGFTDVAVGRHQDGRLAVFAVAADRTLRLRSQAAPNDVFGAEVNLGGSVTRVEVGATSTGRQYVFGVGPDGVMSYMQQASLSGPFGPWLPFGATGVVDLDVVTAQDGRLEVVAGTSGGWLSKRTQLYVDGGWAAWTDLGGRGIGDLDAVLGPDGRQHVFALGGSRVHHVRQHLPGSELWTWEPELGGAQITAVRAERNQDGRLELFALTAAGDVLQTWQTAPSAGESWLPLPGAPVINLFTASSTNPPLGSTVRFDWLLDLYPGCTPSGTLRISSLQSGTTAEYPFEGTSGGTTLFPATQDMRVDLAATCREHITNGFVLESRALLLVKPGAPQPPPYQPVRVIAPTYQVHLGADPAGTGPRSYTAYFGQAIYGGQFTSLANPNPYSISLISAYADSTECFGPSAVTLAPYQRAQAADLVKLHGSTAPALPAFFRGCADASGSNVPVLPVNIDYSYLR
jgi:hypothetical protein